MAHYDAVYGWAESISLEPAKFFVHRHIRPQYACKHCQTITAAPIPPAVIDGGMAAIGLLVWVIISKYLDHLLQGDTLHADETPVAQLDPGKGKTRKAYLLACRSNDLQEDRPRIIVFDYQPGRSGEHARQFLGAWSGHLLVDDYVGYKALFANAGQPLGCIELACLAHARRKFFDLHHANQSPMAQEALQRISALYAIEAEGKALSIEARQQLRRDKSLPQLQAFHDWLVNTRLGIANGGTSAKAMDYTLKRWPALIRYAETGHLPIDNNLIENCIRPIALGRRNWLFTGSERAGKRAAAIQTLLGTAKLNGLNPTSWLKDTLEKLPAWPNRRIDELLTLTPEWIDWIKKNSA